MTKVSDRDVRYIAVADVRFQRSPNRASWWKLNGYLDISHRPAETNAVCMFLPNGYPHVNNTYILRT